MKLGKRKPVPNPKYESPDEDAVPAKPAKRSKKAKRLEDEGNGAGPSRPSRPRVEKVDFDKTEHKTMKDKVVAYKTAAEEAQTAIASWNSAMDAVELEALVGIVVRTMLFREHEKPGVPVKREELMEAIKVHFRAHKHIKKLPALAITLAQARLAGAFGIEMREVEQRSGGGGGRGRPPAQQPEPDEGGGSVRYTYVLRSLLPTALRREFVDSSERDASHGLAMLVLALVELNGGKMDAGAVLRHLERLGVAGSAHDPHPVFGADPKAELQDMEKRRLLVCTKVNGPEGPILTYQWGEVAHECIGVAAVKEWYDKVFEQAAVAVPPLEEEGDEVE